MITEVNAKNMSADELERYAYIGDPVAKAALDDRADEINRMSATEFAIKELEDELEEVSEELRTAQNAVDDLESDVSHIKRKIKALRKGETH
ncbi:MAG: hypothetical protein V4607_01905 [Pseudomonadota bacterium]